MRATCHLVWRPGRPEESADADADADTSIEVVSLELAKQRPLRSHHRFNGCSPRDPAPCTQPPRRTSGAVAPARAGEAYPGGGATGPTPRKALTRPVGHVLRCNRGKLSPRKAVRGRPAHPALPLKRNGPRRGAADNPGRVGVALVSAGPAHLRMSTPKTTADSASAGSRMGRGGIPATEARGAPEVGNFRNAGRTFCTCVG